MFLYRFYPIRYCMPMKSGRDGVMPLPEYKNIQLFLINILHRTVEITLSIT